MPALLAASGACSTRGAYHGLQAGQRNDCLRVPPSVYEECIGETLRSYDEYQEARGRLDGAGEGDQGSADPSRP